MVRELKLLEASQLAVKRLAVVPEKSYLEAIKVKHL
jgi:hypothetical protein